MNEITICLTDEEIEYIILFMDIGVCAFGDFNEIDHDTWKSKPEYMSKAKRVIKELEEIIKYDFLLRFMGVD